MSAPVRVFLATTKRLVLGNYNFPSRFVSTTSPVNSEPSLPQYTDYEVSKEDFKYVKKLLPPGTVPEPPEDGKPTTTGWVPQTGNINEKIYWIRRTKNHMLPVYLGEKNGGASQVTSIRKIEGDIWAFDKDLRHAVGKMVSKRMLTQINEVSRTIKLKGNYMKEVGEFLVKQGL
ncbi:39S ribosomal protein L49, mitochondrial-like [Mizuhopecten yessoensis]|uniref:Large ribosomal subunit protein mL49 n=1 Tax=Mizuhopecten yessoensis TaxID=6573 RepID=A0A210PUQ7_MIZYE|nr:39S ribosomal protein L49, mitochondrial-like [Mizuhopecten yessoensis]OWF40237.1 39S ribosomal protein L49, mitochondrial [Mizuhopecten yessoensis]